MAVEKPLIPVAPEGEKPPEKKETPKVPGGVPIDQGPEKKDQPQIKPKENVSAADKEFMKKHGGAIYDLSQVPGYEQKGYNCPVYVNMPPDMSKFTKDGKPVKPRIIFYAHGNGEQDLEKTKYIMAQVEKMRANGDPVILVRPIDATAAPKHNWDQFKKPDTLQDIIRMTEQLARTGVAPDISMSGFSGGYHAIGEGLKHLRMRAAEDPEAARTYARIARIGLLDAMYGYDEEFAAWAKEKDHVLRCTYSDSSGFYAARLKRNVELAGGRATAKMAGGRGEHGDAPLDFLAYMSSPVTGMPEMPELAPAKALPLQVAAAEVPAQPETSFPTYQLPAKGLPVAKGGGEYYPAPAKAKTVHYEQETPAPAEAAPAPVEAAPAHVAPTPAPIEHKEVEPGKKGATLFMGDSITVQIEKAGQFADFSQVETLAKGSQTSAWLLRKLEERVQSDPNSLSSFENGVVLIGTNDIGGSGEKFTADAIFGRIEKIWKLLIEKGVKVYACTIPPFAGYKGYNKRFEAINQKRLKINEMIMQSSLPHKKIDLCLGKSQGGLADDEDPNKLTAGISSDKLHIDKKTLGGLYAREVEPQNSKAA